MARKIWNFDDDEYPSSFAEVRHLLIPGPYWKRLADSLTEPDLTQLLDDLADWDQATSEHSQHPPKPRHPSEGRVGNGA